MFEYLPWVQREANNALVNQDELAADSPAAVFHPVPVVAAPPVTGHGVQQVVAMFD